MDTWPGIASKCILLNLHFFIAYLYSVFTYMETHHAREYILRYSVIQVTFFTAERRKKTETGRTT